ncbi:MAG: hypothetical protein WC723_03425 [Candidatus Omnitrophota bacterium]
MRIILAALLFLGIVNISNVFAQGNDVFTFIPQDSQIVISFNMLKNDEGVSYLKKQLRERFIKQCIVQSKKRAVLDIYNWSGDINAAIGVKFSKDGKKYRVLLVLGFPENLSGKIERMAKIVESLLTKRNPLRYMSYGKYEIGYSSDRYPREFSSYCVTGNSLLISSDKEMLKEALSVHGVKSRQTILNNLDFQRVLDNKIGTLRDCFVFINFIDSEFMNAVKLWQNKYFTFLLSGKMLKYAVLELDIVNKDRINGALHLVPVKKENASEEIRDDFFFIDEILKRKCSAESINYNSRKNELTNGLDLYFSMYNLNTFWERLNK